MTSPSSLSPSVEARSFCHPRAAVLVLAAAAVIAAFAPAQGTDCLVTGPSVAECGIVQFYVATVPQNQNPFDVVWSLLNNSAGASFVGPNACVQVNSCPVNISVTTVGQVTVHATITTFLGVVKECEAVLTVVDVTPPVITCPPDANVECGGSLDPAATGTPTATDTCGGTTLTYGDTVTGSNCAGAVYARTWTALDDHGNSATCTQIITTVDTTPPNLVCPGPVTVQCFSQVPPADPGSVASSDNCGGLVSVTHVGDAPSNGQSSCNNVITRTYLGTDLCGNTNTCTQTITVNDTTPPTLTCPGNVTVQCFSQVPPAVPGQVQTSDNCGGFVNVVWGGDSATNGQSNCNNVITRTYLGMDPCGNTNTCTQIITVNDTTPPTLVCPGPLAVQCFPLPPPDPLSVQASDNCGGLVTVTHLTDFGVPGCNTVITRTYQATDSCGNTNTCTQLITVNDTTPPVLTCPAAAGVECFSQIPLPDPLSVQATDNCGGLVNVVWAGDVPSNGQSSCNNVITRTYLGTDPCGNTNTCTQTITVNDTTAPTLTCPGAVTVECFSQVPQADPGAVQTSDNCGGLVTVTHAGDVSSNGASNCTVITRTYTGADPCGNTNTCTQTITVADTTPPAITCPPDFTLPCGTPTDPGVTGFATATDNCDPFPVITFTDVNNGTCPQAASITRTWSATDSCNNTSTCVQIITLIEGPGQGCIPALVTDLGGACGAPPPILMASLPILGGYLSFHIASNTNNAQILLVAETPPLPNPIPLVQPCVLWVDPAGPNSVLLDMFYTDGIGDWGSRWQLAIIPQLVSMNIRLQAGILSPGGPLVFAQLTNAIQVTVGTCPPFCTFSREDYAGNLTPGMIFDTNWLIVFPGGMDIGTYNPGNGNVPPNGFRWTGDVAGRNALKSFLMSNDGTPSPLVADAINPIATLGAGTLARLTAVLRLNIGFNQAGLLGSPTPGFGNLIYINPYAPDSLSGFTVSQILGVCDSVLAGGPLPSGYTYITLADLLEELSLSFEDCVPSFWSSKYLFIQ